MTTPEPGYREELRRLVGETGQVRQHLATLAVHTPGQPDRFIAALPTWQATPERPGVRTYHVPHPSGVPGLFLAIYAIEAGVSDAQTTTDEARLTLVVAGELDLNGRRYRAGECVYLAPGEPSTWSVPDGLTAVVAFDVPPPDFTPTC